MTRVLLIGNSHLAAFRKGFDAVDLTGLDVEFFRLAGQNYYRMRLDPISTEFGAIEGVRQPPNLVEQIIAMNGRASIRTGDFDHIVIVGNEHGTIELVRLLAENDIDGVRSAGTRRAMSRAAYDAFLDDIVDAYLPVDPWSGLDGVQVTFHAKPRMPANIARAAPDRIFERECGIPLSERSDGVAAALDDLAGRYAARLATAGLSFTEQPAETILPSGFTDARFADVMIGQGERAQLDVRHMNADYGIACLTALLPRLRGEA